MKYKQYTPLVWLITLLLIFFSTFQSYRIIKHKNKVHNSLHKVFKSLFLQDEEWTYQGSLFRYQDLQDQIKNIYEGRSKIQSDIISQTTQKGNIKLIKYTKNQIYKGEYILDSEKSPLNYKDMKSIIDFTQHHKYFEILIPNIKVINKHSSYQDNCLIWQFRMIYSVYQNKIDYQVDYKSRLCATSLFTFYNMKFIIFDIFGAIVALISLYVEIVYLFQQYNLYFQTNNQSFIDRYSNNFFKQVNYYDHWKELDIYQVMKIFNSCLYFVANVGSIITYFTTDYFIFRSLIVISCAFFWISLLDYMDMNFTYINIFETFTSVKYQVAYYLLSVGIFFVAWAILLYTMFWKYTPFFGSFVKSISTCFAVIFGDSLLDIFTSIYPAGVIGGTVFAFYSFMFFTNAMTLFITIIGIGYDKSQEYKQKLKEQFETEKERIDQLELSQDLSFQEEYYQENTTDEKSIIKCIEANQIDYKFDYRSSFKTTSNRIQRILEEIKETNEYYIDEEEFIIQGEENELQICELGIRQLNNLLKQF